MKEMRKWVKEELEEKGGEALAISLLMCATPVLPINNYADAATVLSLVKDQQSLTETIMGMSIAACRLDVKEYVDNLTNLLKDSHLYSTFTGIVELTRMGEGNVPVEEIEMEMEEGKTYGELLNMDPAVSYSGTELVQKLMEADKRIRAMVLATLVQQVIDAMVVLDTKRGRGQ